MKKIMIHSAAIGAMFLATPVFAQAPPSNSVTLSWTNPSAYQSGQSLTIGRVNVSYDVTETSQSGPATTLTTPALTPGTHTFSVVVCDNLTPQTCSQPSSTTATIPSVGLVVPPATGLNVIVNP
jgi:hypothetical protein